MIDSELTIRNIGKKMETFRSLVEAIEKNNEFNDASWKDWENSKHVEEIYGPLDELDSFTNFARKAINHLIFTDGREVERFLECYDTLGIILIEYTLSSVEKQSMTPLQKELSKKLSEGEKLQTLADWKMLQEVDVKAIETDRRLDKLLAEIEVTAGESAQPFLARATLIGQESSSSRRSLLTDSLILDLVAHSNERKSKEIAIASMREIRCELHRLTSKPAKDLEVLLTKAIDSNDISSGKLLRDKGVALLKEETKANVK